MGIMDFVKGALFEEPEGAQAPAEPEPEVATPKPPLARTVSSPLIKIPTSTPPAPVAAEANAAPSDGELQNAQRVVLGYAAYSTLPSLQRFEATDAALQGTIADANARRSAVFATIGAAANITPASVVTEATTATTKLRAAVENYRTTCDSRVAGLQSDEQRDYQALSEKIASDEEQIRFLQERIQQNTASRDALAGTYAAKVAAVTREHAILADVADQYLAGWDDIIAHK